MRFDAGLLLTGQRFPRHRYEVRSTPAQGRADYHWHSLAVELGVHRCDKFGSLVRAEPWHRSLRVRW